MLVAGPPKRFSIYLESLLIRRQVPRSDSGQEERLPCHPRPQEPPSHPIINKVAKQTDLLANRSREGQFAHHHLLTPSWSGGLPGACLVKPGGNPPGALGKVGENTRYRHFRRTYPGCCGEIYRFKGNHSLHHNNRIKNRNS